MSSSPTPSHATLRFCWKTQVSRRSLARNRQKWKKTAANASVLAEKPLCETPMSRFPPLPRPTRHLDFPSRHAKCRAGDTALIALGAPRIIRREIVTAGFKVVLAIHPGRSAPTRWQRREEIHAGTIRMTVEQLQLPADLHTGTGFTTRKNAEYVVYCKRVKPCGVMPVCTKLSAAARAQPQTRRVVSPHRAICRRRRAVSGIVCEAPTWLDDLGFGKEKIRSARHVRGDMSNCARRGWRATPARSSARASYVILVANW